MKRSEILLKFLELQSESLSIRMKETLKIDSPTALQADMKVPAFSETDQFSFCSAELTEKLEMLFSAVGEFAGAIDKIFPDKYKSISKLEMFVLSIYTTKILDFFKFFFDAEILRLKFQRRQFDVNDFAENFIKICGTQFLSKSFDQFESTVDFTEKTHDSSRLYDSCNHSLCRQHGEEQRNTEGR